MAHKAQENLLELSRQGDPEAIATLINRSLQPKGIRTEAEQDGGYLYLFLEATPAPRQEEVVPFIQHGLISLGIEAIHTVKIFGRQRGDRQPVWQQQVELGTVAPLGMETQSDSTTLQQPSSSRYPQQTPSSEPTSSPPTLLQTLRNSLLRKPSSDHGPSENGLSPTEVQTIAPAYGKGPGLSYENYPRLVIGPRMLRLTPYGGLVSLSAPETAPILRQRPAPNPRQSCLPFPELVGRQVETEAAVSALTSSIPVEFYGEIGLGKTSLLRSLVYHPTLTEAFGDGIVYRAVRQTSLADLLHGIFTDFYDYESSIPVIPTPTDIRGILPEKRALIILDDATLSQDEVEELISTASGMTLLLAATDAHLWGEGRDIPLTGLRLPEALTLVERSLKRPLTEGERESATTLCNLLGGHPLHIRQAIAVTQIPTYPLPTVIDQLQQGTAPEVLTVKAATTLPEPERRILAALVVLNGISIRTEHLTALTALPNLDSVLPSLVERSLVLTNGVRYRLAENLASPFQQVWKLDQWTQRIVNYFTSWAEQQQPGAETLLEEKNVLIRVQDIALATGQPGEAIRLARALDSALPVYGLWGAWEHVLQRGVQAARAIADQSSEAWAMHQLGARALCLDDVFAAQTWLTQALQLREALGDSDGASITRENLGLLATKPAEPEPVAYPVTISEQPDDPNRSPSWLKWALLAGLFATAGAAIAVLYNSSRSPRLWFSQERLEFSEQTVNTQGESQTVTVQNRTAEPLAIAQIIPAGANPEDFEVLAEDCTSQPLIPEEDCSVQVSFVPTEEGNRRADLSFLTADGETLQRLPLRGTGIPPAGPLVVSLTPGSLNFGDRTLNTQSETSVITLANVGTQPLTIERIEIGGVHRADFQADEDCITGPPLQTDEQCTINVAFTPTAGGNRTASIVIQAQGSDRPWVVPLRGYGLDSSTGNGTDGTAIGPATTQSELRISPTSLNFGQVQISPGTAASDATQTVTLTNPGSTPITIQELRLSGGNTDFQANSDCYGVPVEPNGSCVVDVTFQPTASGNRTAELIITSNAQNASVRVPLSGTGVSPSSQVTQTPGIGVSPTTLTFGSQEIYPDAKIVTITNTGAADLRIGTVTFTGPDANVFTTRGGNGTIVCSNTTLAPNERCNFSVAFRGSSAGDRTAQISIPSNAGSGTAVVNLAGRGAPQPEEGPELSVSEANINFGSQALDVSSPDQPLTLTNTGSARLEVGNITLTGDRDFYAYPNSYNTNNINCSFQALEPGESCQLILTFTPTIEGAHQAQLSIPSNDPDSPLTVELTGVGTVAQTSSTESAPATSYGLFGR